MGCLNQFDTGAESLDNPHFAAYLVANKYVSARTLEDGTVAAIIKLLYTTAICTNIGWIGYGNRFCFESPVRAAIELQKLTACDDEPTGWIARR